MACNLRKGDLVIISTGKDRGKTGRIVKIDHVKQRVFVEGLNMVKKAMRQRSQNDHGGIITLNASLHWSNVSAVAKDGKPSRIGFQITREKKVRVLKRHGEIYGEG